MWQESSNLTNAFGDLSIGSIWQETPDCSESSLVSQLQTTLDLQQQLDIFSMSAGRVLPLCGMTLNTHSSNLQARGSKKGAYHHQSKLVLENQVLAEISYDSAHAFTPLVQRQLLLLESEWLFALRNALLVSRLQQMALKDPLTTLGNRRFFDDSFVKSVQLAKRHQLPLTLLLLDLDNFKQVNDNSGHYVGDEVLIAVADCMRESLRATDSLFRFGGDEFAVLLSDSDAEHADVVADRLLQSIYTNAFLASHNVGCSIGMARLSAEHQPRDLFHAADEALYQAKLSGKGRVSQYNGGRVKLLEKAAHSLLAAS
ncbi:GGDEF domain-containing protein [Alishewanella sp. HL-SH06]|uniref:GGDEF domain-containing protein n=1 Tax=Alishewanella sp. HL-SH06 TaxID=3461144 RepID=UPI0040430AA9